jgi:hypothetical protein
MESTMLPQAESARNAGHRVSPVKKKSTMLPFVLSEVEGQAKKHNKHV